MDTACIFSPKTISEQTLPAKALATPGAKQSEIRLPEIYRLKGFSTLILRKNPEADECIRFKKTDEAIILELSGSCPQS